MLCTDTLYGNAGLGGGYYPPSILCLSPLFSLCRIVAGLIGTFPYVTHLRYPVLTLPTATLEGSVLVWVAIYQVNLL